jgi:hypothetical protein
MYFSPRFLLHRTVPAGVPRHRFNMKIHPRIFILIYAFLFVLVCSPLAQAQIKQFIEKINDLDDSIGNEYYTIADPDENVADFITPLTALDTLDALKNIWTENNNLLTEQNLLNWVFHETLNPDVPEKYQRRTHFGTWIRDPSRKTCMNIRGLVLQRDALGELTYADDRHCRIVASHWVDPYTNTELYDAEDVQIDHMVPLKNAYISGAWAWNATQRCNYANFMGNGFHLLAVLGTENNRKSDRTPNKYIPPKADYVCQYLVNWLKIKSIWRLKLAKDEALSIERELKIYNCNIQDFQLNLDDLHSQRGKSYESPATCPRSSEF